MPSRLVDWALRGLVQTMVDNKQGLWTGPTPLLATKALLYVFEYALGNPEITEGHNKIVAELEAHLAATLKCCVSQRRPQYS